MRVLLLSLAAGCAGHQAEVRGQAPSGVPVPVARLASAPADKTVTVRGTMVEKCPAAGCWFILQDGTGRVKVDLKAGGFVVTDVPTGGETTVTGRLKHRDQETVVEASGARFQ
jgi:uncharacterized protein YdeI (BOF family)